MSGVASRNAKRAASLCDRPTSRPPPIDAPEREKPGMSAIDWTAPTVNPCPQPTVLRDPFVVVVGHDRSPPPQRLGAEEHQRR